MEYSQDLKQTNLNDIIFFFFNFLLKITIAIMKKIYIFLR